MTKVTLFPIYLQTYLSVSIIYILRVEDNYSLCFHAGTGEKFSSGADLSTSRTNDTTSELDAYSTQRANEGSRKNGPSYCGLIIYT